MSAIDVGEEVRELTPHQQEVGCGRVTIQDVVSVHQAIAPLIHRTPLLTCKAISATVSTSALPIELFFKCENFQKTGSFKARGALNAVRQLSDEEKKKGVCTHSSGNHAQALAFAAQTFGIPAHVVMPQNAPAVKRTAVAETYKGNVIECGNLPADREAVCKEVIASTGAHFVHPANDLRVIAGQGTVALEILQELKDLHVVVVPVGGGGLSSGTCITVKSLRPDVLVFGAEPLGADDAYRSLQAGYIIPQTSPKTIADGLRTSIYDNTFAILSKNVDRIITVDEDAIIAANRLIWQRAKIVVEPSSAVTLAAVMSPVFEEATVNLRASTPGPLKVALILSGGNVEF